MYSFLFDEKEYIEKFSFDFRIKNRHEKLHLYFTTGFIYL